MVVMAWLQELVPHSLNIGWCGTSSWGRDCISTAGGSFSLSVWCVRSRDSSKRHLPPGPLSARQGITEKLWRDFFADPSLWWDHRSDKVNPRYPDFRHKKTRQALWLDNHLTPPWVEAELLAGSLQSNLSSWNGRLRRYVKAGDHEMTMELYQHMQREGMAPDKFTFVPVLNACCGLQSLEDGRRVHEQIIETGYECDIYVATCLVDMYGKCGSIEDAWNVFNKMRERNVVSWSSMIGGYVKSGQGLKAIELFRTMQQEAVEPNAITYVGVLNACASLAALKEGRGIHEQIIERGYERNVYVANSLVDMYVKCGRIYNAWSVFRKMPNRNAISWSVIIRGYVNSGQGLKAVKLFWKMQQEGVEPDNVTFIGMLNACASVAALEDGKLAHKQIIQRGYESDVYVANGLVDMYAKCGSIEDAWSVFNKMERHSVVSWNALIGGYMKCGEGLKSIELFRKMQQEGVEPNTITFVGVLNACASVGALEEGRGVHKQVIQRDFESDDHVATCLVDMYAKCGSIGDAWSVFTKLRQQNVVSWSAMIRGYVKSGQRRKAIELFQQMQQEGVEPNSVTFVEVLNACADVAALEEGRHVHKQIIQNGCESDVFVANCLVDMYAKCGSIGDAWNVFSKMQEHDVVSWNGMIGGYAMHGHAEKAIGLFKQMGKSSVQINGITFTCLLSACSHAGLVKEGLRYFKSMTSLYDIVPTEEHYACMVDLFGRAGRLEEAEQMTKRLPVERNAAVWMSLLGACRVHGNIEVAERAAKKFWMLDPENVSGHVLLLNTYAAAGKWDKIAAIDNEMLKEKSEMNQVLDRGE